MTMLFSEPFEDDFGMYSPEGNALVAALVQEIEAMQSTTADERVIAHLQTGMAAIAAQGHDEVDDTAVRESIVARLAESTDRDLCPYTQVVPPEPSPEGLLAALKADPKLVGSLEELLAALKGKSNL